MSFLGHEFEGDFKKVLCVCSGGILRSPTTAWILSQKPYEFNTRAAGTHEYALIPVSDALVTWADKIICMENHHYRHIMDNYALRAKQKIYVLDVPDQYEYRDPKLIKLIRGKLESIFEP